MYNKLIWILWCTQLGCNINVIMMSCDRRTIHTRSRAEKSEINVQFLFVPSIDIA